MTPAVTESRWSWLWPLFCVVILDYIAQIPYYVVNDFQAHGNPPSASALALLGVTLAWFLVGFFGYRSGRPFGFWLLVSFLLVEGSFYLVTIFAGVAAFQLGNPNPVNKAVFIVGYVTGIVSLIYLFVIVLLRARNMRRRFIP